MVTIKLAEALLRRKELQQKVDQLRQINVKELFEVKSGRRKAHEGLDDFILEVPYLSAQQVTHEYDFHARALRKIDAAIQQANWTTNIELDDSTVCDYEVPKGAMKRK